MQYAYIYIYIYVHIRVSICIFICICVLMCIIICKQICVYYIYIYLPRPMCIHLYVQANINDTSWYICKAFHTSELYRLTSEHVVICLKPTAAPIWSQCAVHFEKQLFNLSLQNNRSRLRWVSGTGAKYINIEQIWRHGFHFPSHSVINYKWKPPHDLQLTTTCVHLLWETNQAAHRLHMSLIWLQWPVCSWQRLGTASCLSAAIMAWVHHTPLTRPPSSLHLNDVKWLAHSTQEHSGKSWTYGTWNTSGSWSNLQECNTSCHSMNYACPAALQSLDPRPQTKNNSSQFQIMIPKKGWNIIQIILEPPRKDPGIAWTWGTCSFSGPGCSLEAVAPKAQRRWLAPRPRQLPGWSSKCLAGGS